jgi:hypothetical protein
MFVVMMPRVSGVFAMLVALVLGLHIGSAQGETQDTDEGKDERFHSTV